ncbi:penicillin-binding protein activator [Lentibacter sp. XHP0401]|jgi:Periplasmic binding protein|uniref:penicillin-binding protein activator n=1 Tax=Lentibacter sp. XHP0401 TaxID=2984334 RepID=UPI0021E9A4B9|nr:penicillin-binding protein activator [Lentibacter sp. XHP0401]MCV2894049.1 penicillin-binding protein activator [Lentibacter sp. XHP0401]
MFAVLSAARKPFVKLFALMSLVWLAACEPVSLSGPASGGGNLKAGDAVKVALLLPRGSAIQGDSLVSDSLENAARLAVADLQGVKIDLRVYATAGDAGRAQTAAKQAVADGAQVIIGPLRAESANAAAVAVAPSGVNVLAFSNNTTIAGGNLFLLGSTFNNSADRLTAYAKRNGKDRILVVHDEEVGGQLGKAAITQSIARTGATLAGTIGYERSQQGVTTAVQRIKAAAAAGNANAIFLTSTSDAALPFYAQMLPEVGISNANTQFIGLSRWDIPAQTLQLPGLQGGWFSLPDPAKAGQFSARYTGAYGSQPHPLAALAYDGIAAVGALASSGRRNALSASSLTQGAGFQGANGIFRLRPDGTNERGLAIAQIQDRKVVIIDAAPSSFSGAGF